MVRHSSIERAKKKSSGTISIAAPGLSYSGYLFLQDSPDVLAAAFTGIALFLLTSTVGLFLYGPKLFVQEDETGP